MLIDIPNEIYWIAIPLALAFSLTIAFFIFRRPRPKKYIIDVNPIVKAMGGSSNIISVRSAGSRLSFELQDMALIDQAALHDYGVSSVLIMTKKAVLLVGTTAGPLADAIADIIKQSH